MSSSSPSSSSSNPPPDSEEPETRNWLDLPRDVTSTILLKLGAIEILTNAQRVCTQWRSICKDSLMWRAIDMRNSGDLHDMMDHDLDIMCRHAIDRSCGQLIDINVEHFGTDDLLMYITDSTSHLQRLRLVRCYGISDEGLNEVAKKLPCLEELDISISNLSKDALEAIGRCCPLLKSLKFNKLFFRHPLIDCDEEAFAIAQTMPGLRHLQLFGNKLTNDGLLAILDGCPYLESLDLRQCFDVNLRGSLEKRCAEQIKDLRHPWAPIYDYLFEDENYYDDDEPFDNDYDLYGYGSDFEAYYGF